MTEEEVKEKTEEETKKGLFRKRKRHIRIDADYQKKMSRESRLLRLFFEHFIMSKRTPLKELMMRMERDIIVRTLNKFDGTQRMAAKILGVKNTTFNEKIKKYDIYLKRVKREYI